MLVLSPTYAQIVATVQRDIKLGTLQTSQTNNQERDIGNYRRATSSAEAGSSIDAQGSLHLQAGNDINARAANVTAAKRLDVNAGNNIILQAGQATTNVDQMASASGSDFFTTSSIQTQRQSSSATAQVSSLQGQSTNLVAQNNLVSVGANLQASGAAGGSGTLHVEGKNQTLLYETQNVSQSSTTTRSTTKLNANYFKGVDASSKFETQLFKNVTNNLASSAMDAAVNGKAFDEIAISKALSSALVTTGMAQGAYAIGDAKDLNQLNTFTHKLAHAVLGCAGGTATAGNASGCAPGAVGAVVGELTAEYAKSNKMSDTDSLALAKVLSAVSGVVVGGGGDNAAAVNVAANAGANAAENNFLVHAQKEELSQLRKKCVSAQACSSEEQSRISELLALEKKPYYSGKPGQFTQDQLEAERAYTGLTDAQLSAQRDADQQVIEGKFAQQSAASKAKVWQNFQQYAQERDAQTAQPQPSDMGSGAAVRGATDAVKTLVASMADLPEAGRAS